MKAESPNKIGYSAFFVVLCCLARSMDVSPDWGYFWEKAVTEPDLKSFMANIGQHDSGIFFCTGGFTRDAENYARSQESKRIMLIDSAKLVQLDGQYPSSERSGMAALIADVNLLSDAGGVAGKNYICRCHRGAIRYNRTRVYVRYGGNKSIVTLRYYDVMLLLFWDESPPITRIALAPKAIPVGTGCFLNTLPTATTPIAMAFSKITARGFAITPRVISAT